MTRARSAWATRLLVFSTLSAISLLAVAQQPGPRLSPEQMQQQMQRGYGPGYGPGYGMGPGMMGDGYGPGYGPGPGMMGGGYGPGYGMGPGMMGDGYGYGAPEGGYGRGYSAGPGAMGDGMGPLYMLNLSDSQRDRVEKIGDAERKQHWDLTGKILEEQNKLRDLYQSDEPDPKKVGAVYGDIAKLQQQMLEIHVQANNEIQHVLTKEQREQLKQWQRGAWGQGGGYGPGTGPGMMGR
jgi:Spy/CpxP family protein refolding chaperone